MLFCKLNGFSRKKSNAQLFFQVTPLWTACQSAQSDIIKCLLKFGAKINEKNKDEVSFKKKFVLRISLF